MMDVCAASREDLAFPIGSWLDAPVFTGDVYLKPMVQGDASPSVNTVTFAPGRGDSTTRKWKAKN
ncbi:MAG: hypothetical protein MR519_03830 [Spirochaetaceae bacterium]|nr:hypothetical protein [Spirochaetaceae bacterium]